MNATRKNIAHSLVDELHCPNKWTNVCVCVYVCVCVCVCVCVYVHVYLCCSGNKLPINSLKAEDILETTRWKVKNMQNICNIEIKWCVSEFFFKVFSFKCWRNKSTTFFFQKIRKITTLFSCYLMANNQLKCRIIYKKIKRDMDLCSRLSRFKKFIFIFFLKYFCTLIFHLAVAFQRYRIYYFFQIFKKL